MEKLTLHEQMVELQKEKDHHKESLVAITNALEDLIRQEKQQNLPKITESTFDALLESIIDAVKMIGITNDNSDIYYTINGNEIESEIALEANYFDEVFEIVRRTVYDGDFVAIIEDNKIEHTTTKEIY